MIILCFVIRWLWNKSKSNQSVIKYCFVSQQTLTNIKHFKGTHILMEVWFMKWLSWWSFRALPTVRSNQFGYGQKCPQGTNTRVWSGKGYEVSDISVYWWHYLWGCVQFIPRTVCEVLCCNYYMSIEHFCCHYYYYYFFIFFFAEFLFGYMLYTFVYLFVVLIYMFLVAIFNSI